MFNRKYIFKGSIFHCYVRLPECIHFLGCFFFVPASDCGATAVTSSVSQFFFEQLDLLEVKALKNSPEV